MPRKGRKAPLVKCPACGAMVRVSKKGWLMPHYGKWPVRCFCGHPPKP